jgi:cation diffusion facilitator CzcD-associated flavoprotein CzcO
LKKTRIQNPIQGKSYQLKRVLVVGSGVSGLAAAKTFLQFGYKDVIILEKTNEIGGVWRSDQYSGASVQGPHWLYAFVDFPWTADFAKGETSPCRASVQAYCEGYAERFGLLSKIKFNHELKSACRDATRNVWVVQTAHHGSFEAEILIMGVGNNDKSHPIIPDIPHRGAYQGKILHSSQVGDGMDLAEAANVVVIGGSKSAYEIGQLQPYKTTFVMRTPHWWCPRWLICLPFFDRIANLLFRGYRVDARKRPWMVRVLDELVLPVLAVGTNTPKKSPSFLDDVMVGGGFHVCTTREQYENAKKWDLRRSRPVCYTETGLKLDNGEILQADVIVWGTGFQPTKFLKEVFVDVHLQDCLDDGLYLYKYIAHPALPDCYFCGFRDPSVNVPFAANVQSLWAAFCAAGMVDLPAPAGMRCLLDERQRDTRLKLPQSHRRAFCDYFLRDPRCEYDYALDLIRDCGLESLVASFWCRPLNIWTASEDFGAVLGAKIVEHQVPEAEASDSTALLS